MSTCSVAVLLSAAPRHSVSARLRMITKPATDSLCAGTLADLVRSKPELIAENALLRQQLIILRRSTKRPRYTRVDRAVLVLLAAHLAPEPPDCAARYPAPLASRPVSSLLAP
jgi:hypothetical protein